MAAADLSGKTDKEIGRLIANHETRGATAAPLYKAALEEKARRRGFDFEKSLAAIRASAAREEFISFAQLAEASGAEWRKVRYEVGGHLWDLVRWAKDRNLPMLSAVVVNKPNLATGDMDPKTLEGFVRAAEELGRPVDDAKAFLAAEQKAVFEWAGAGEGAGA